MHFTIYEYDAAGALSPDAKVDTFSTRTIDCIRTLFAADVDFVSEIEGHSTVKVNVT